MRTFDIIGALAVCGWLAFTGAYVWKHEFAGRTSAPTPAGGVDMAEGDTWLLLRRDEEDIGYIHQTRTRLTDGWLREYDMLILADILERTLPLESRIKARLDTDARLTEFTAELDAVGRSVDARGTIDDTTLELTVQTDESVRRRTLQLGQRPRLATNAVHQLLGQPDLAPGDTFEQTYFNATSFGMRPITMEYVGQKTVDVFDQTHEARHVRQSIGGRELDVYVDADGKILVQEFPLKIVGTRVSPDLGRARAASLGQKADELDGELPDGVGAGLETALDLVGFGDHLLLDEDSEISVPDPGDSRPDAGDTAPRPDAAPP